MRHSYSEDRPQRHRLGLAAIVMCVTIVGSACQAQQPTGAPSGSAPVSATAAPPTASPTPALSDATVTLLVTTLGNEHFDPFSGDSATQYFLRLFDAPLIEGDGTGAGLSPGIVDKWDMSADGKTWTFHVRSGVKAQNGETIDAEDVRWNLDSRFGDEAKQRVKAGEVPDENTVSGIIPLVESVTLDATAQNVVVKLTESRPDFAYRMSANTPDTANAVIPEDYFKQKTVDGYQKEPVGTGAFKLTSYTPGVEMDFERYDDYFYQPANGFPEDRRPQFKKLVVKIVPDAATRVSALQGGQADIIAATPLMIPDITAAGGSLAYGKEGAYPDIRFIDCWDTKIWCYDAKVREALEYAVDKETLLTRLFGADAGEVKGWQWVTPHSLGYVAGVTDPYPFNVDMAKDLLKQAGHEGGAGIPQITINAWEGGVPFLPEIAQVLADSWKAIGVNAVAKVGDEQALRAALNGRQLGGQILVRDNEARWNGLDVTTVQYTDPEFGTRFCDPSAPNCTDIIALVKEKMFKVYPDVQSTSAAFADVYKVIRADDRAWSPFYLHQPWGLGPRIASYSPWPLNAYNTAIWTVQVKPGS
jgi:ABC-type transport system substrate-binding protein